jgi:hypothetical protein
MKDFLKTWNVNTVEVRVLGSFQKLETNLKKLAKSLFVKCISEKVDTRKNSTHGDSFLSTVHMTQ